MTLINLVKIFLKIKMNSSFVLVSCFTFNPNIEFRTSIMIKVVNLQD